MTGFTTTVPLIVVLIAVNATLFADDGAIAVKDPVEISLLAGATKKATDCGTQGTSASPPTKSQTAWQASTGFAGVAGSHVDILSAGKTLVRYMYSHDPSTKNRLRTYKPFHHVLADDGKSLITNGHEGKFTHHRGLFIGWNRLEHHGKNFDLWHMKGQGTGATQKHIRFLTQRADSDRSVLATQIHWITDDATKPAVDETRTITVWHGDSTSHLQLDFVSELKAINGRVVLGGDPEHAGMQYRAHNDVATNKSARYLFHDEGVQVRASRDLPWAAMIYEVAGTTYTAQHMNHPSNPRGTRYSAYRDYGRFGAFVRSTIEDQESLTLRYRIRVLIGAAPTREELQKQYEQYQRAASK